MNINSRLAEIARQRGMAPAALTQQYAMERFLKRLADSPYAAQFYLKGGMLLMAIGHSPARTTMDIDLLGRISNQPDRLRQIFREIIHTKVGNADEVSFSDSLSITEIAKDALYVGQRIEFEARVGRAHCPMKVDIGFCDEIYPEPVQYQYPPLVPEMPAPQVWCYTTESVVAEKWQAMVKLKQMNSRMKDIYDLWLLLHARTFDFGRLQQAIFRTFERRNTRTEEYRALHTEAYAAAKQAEWSGYVSKLKANAYRRKPPVSFPDKDLSSVMDEIFAWLEPVMQGTSYHTWVPGKGWK